MVALRCGERLCALPVSSVEESLRPLRIAPLGGTAPFVVGVTTLRGEATPVIDLALLLTGTAEAVPRRWVAVRAGDRRVALSVSDVLGVFAMDESMLADLPGLLSGAAAEHVESVARLDDDLVLVLRAGHLLPEETVTLLTSEPGEPR